MTALSVIESDAFKFMEDVAELHLRNLTPYQIARRLNIKVVEAKAAIKQWEEVVRNDMESRDAARDHLNAMVKRYELLMAEAQENLENLNDMEFSVNVSAQINTTLRSIADFDAKRVDLLQKAGLLDASDLGDELAERERREELLLNVLRNDLCEHCTVVVRDRLTDLTGVVEGTVVEG